MLPSKMVMASQDHGLQAADIAQARKPRCLEKKKEKGKPKQKRIQPTAVLHWGSSHLSNAVTYQEESSLLFSPNGTCPSAANCHKMACEGWAVRALAATAN